MNDKIELLIRELAEKLGTTGEHLWGVLLQQAAITAVTDLMVYVVLIALLLWSARLIQEKITAQPDVADEVVVIAWFFWGIIAGIVIIIIGVNLSSLVGALINPEFWALKQIIN